MEITSKYCRTGDIGLDYTAWVDVSVHNYGGAGTVTVWAKIEQGDDMWKKSEGIYLDAKGSEDLTFEFREVELGGGTIHWSAWVGEW